MVANDTEDSGGKARGSPQTVMISFSFSATI
jgi:hypothetical protein